MDKIFKTDREKIDSCMDVFVTKIYEPAQNQLSLEIALGQVSQIEEDFRVDHKSLFGERIFFDNSSEKFRLSFDSYISYLVVNESYDIGVSGEYQGDIIREYTKSYFIDICRQRTFAFSIIEEITIKHFMLVA